MLIGRISHKLRDHNWLAVCVDVAVVIVSILVAFQIDRWAETRRNEHLETEYLLRLQEDLQMELRRMDLALQYANDRIRAVRLLDHALTEGSETGDPALSLPWAIETAAWRSFPQITAFVYRELQNTGNLTLVRSEPLRRALADHYQELQHDAQIGLDLSAQHEFERQTAGILTIEELVAVENASWGDPPSSTSPGRSFEILASLQQRRGAIDLLPSLVQHHTFNTKVIEAARERAQRLIEQIDSMIRPTD
jgi:hypothetical protein